MKELYKKYLNEGVVMNTLEFDATLESMADYLFMWTQAAKSRHPEYKKEISKIEREWRLLETKMNKLGEKMTNLSYQAGEKS